MDRTTRVILAFIGAGAVGTAVTAFTLRYSVPAPPPPAPSGIALDAVVPVPKLISESLPIRDRDNLALLLERGGLDQDSRLQVIDAVRKSFDVRKLRAGSEIKLTRSISGTLESMEYIIDPDHKLQLSRSNDGYSAAVVDIPGTVHVIPIHGTLEGSLFESMERTGEKAELAISVAEIFAWDLDFYTDPQEGDEFSILVEKKKYANGQPPTYGRILAAKYVNTGTVYEGFLFPDSDGRPQYYARDGRSLRAAFLRSPMKFEARVSSHFSRHRYHPILKIFRPHLGTDYAAPTGTPVQAIASGRVTFSGRSGGAGNLIKIRHANGFETMYMHLSRRFVKAGQRVDQGQRIGLVGSTGLATGPHLDFRVRKNGNYVNFERLRPPRASRITARQMDAFSKERDRLAALMQTGSSTDAAIVASGPSPEDSPSAP